MYGEKIIPSVKDLRLSNKIFRLSWNGPVKFWNIVEPLKVEPCRKKEISSKRAWGSNCSLSLPVPLCFLTVDA